jgi:hypothetical protein
MQACMCQLKHAQRAFGVHCSRCQAIVRCQASPQTTLGWWAYMSAARLNSCLTPCILHLTALAPAARALSLHICAPSLSLTVTLPDLQGTDVGTYLASAGLRPALASVLGAATASSTASSGQQLSSRAAVTPSRSTHLTAWTLLLSHLAALPPDAPNARTLRQALREVPQLVPGLLDALVQYLPLEQYMGGKANAAGGRLRSEQGSRQAINSEIYAGDRVANQDREANPTQAQGQARPSAVLAHDCDCGSVSAYIMSTMHPVSPCRAHPCPRFSRGT